MRDEEQGGNTRQILGKSVAPPLYEERFSLTIALERGEKEGATGLPYRCHMFFSVKNCSVSREEDLAIIVLAIYHTLTLR